MENNEDILLKARLLEAGSIDIPEQFFLLHSGCNVSSTENLYGLEQIFLKLNETVKVRLMCSKDSIYQLQEEKNNSFRIFDRQNQTILKTGVEMVLMESGLLHSPGQALFNLYKKCRRNCAYCPIPLNREPAEFMDYKQFEELMPQLKKLSLKGVGFTCGIPAGWDEEKLVSEIEKIIHTIKKNLGSGICVSAAPPPLEKKNIIRMKDAGLNEIRMNIEIYNPKIFGKMCPGFDYEQTKASIINAAQVFGRNRVSTNMVIGLGESDRDVLDGVEFFASHGVFTTLSPLDIVSGRVKYLTRLMGTEPRRPGAERLYRLACKQREIYKANQLSIHDGIETMCSACGYCNIAPLIDF